MYKFQNNRRIESNSHILSGPGERIANRNNWEVEAQITYLIDYNGIFQTGSILGSVFFAVLI